VEVKTDDQVQAGSPLPKSEEKASRSKSRRKNRQPSKEATKSPPKMMGLKNNIYDFKSDQELLEHKINKVEQSIFETKKGWHRSNHQKWLDNTPFIYDYHKDADSKLHTVRPNQTFVSVRKAQPQLPQVKDLILPFMTEAIEEQMLEEKQY